jgi:preprotein translocase subunit Sec61beta
LVSFFNELEIKKPCSRLVSFFNELEIRKPCSRLVSFFNELEIRKPCSRIVSFFNELEIRKPCLRLVSFFNELEIRKPFSSIFLLDHGFQEDDALEGHHVKGQNSVMASKRSSLNGRNTLWKEHMSRVAIGARILGSNIPTEEMTMSTTGSKS